MRTYDESTNPSNGWRKPADADHPSGSIAPRTRPADDDCVSSGRHALFLRSGTFHECATGRRIIPQDDTHGYMRPRGMISQPIGQFEVDGLDLFAEASSLGIRPGQWPETIIATLDHGNLSFLYSRFEQRGGDVLNVTYEGGSLTLVVWND